MSKIHTKIPHLLTYLFLIMAIAGFINSLYLAISYYTGTPLSCELITGCNEVAQGPYSYIAGVSLTTLGIIYYTFTVLNIILYTFWRNKYNVTVLAFVTTLGLFASLYFVYLQLYIIKVICIYCMISATTATLLFVLSIFIRQHHLSQHTQTLKISERVNTDI